jgi:hypothetical protein
MIELEEVIMVETDDVLEKLAIGRYSGSTVSETFCNIDTQGCNSAY